MKKVLILLSVCLILVGCDPELKLETRTCAERGGTSVQTTTFIYNGTSFYPMIITECKLLKEVK